jgi:nucleoside-diphosphate-sugar epimerase
LLGWLQVDISKARHLLGWAPPITVEEGLRRCFESQEK